MDRQRQFVPFTLASSYTPRGDQPQAIEGINQNISSGAQYQTLLGVTGSGKTYTIGNIIAAQNRPTLVIAPNKTLAAQLYAEYRDLFPQNNVRYFVSYYDYYQPEAYVPSTDTFIEKDAQINEEIDKMRHAATRALLETTDVIIVASVSCIYGLGAPDEYFKNMLFVERGETIAREDVLKRLVLMQYRRTDIEFARGTFRVRGDLVDIFPSDQSSRAIRLNFFGNEIEEIVEIDSLSGTTIRQLAYGAVYPVSHYVASGDSVSKAIRTIRAELKERLIELNNQGKVLEAQRLESRTLYDLELLDELGFCPGIENYSRHLAGRKAGEPPTTLIDYFPKNFIVVIDESHVTVPQIQGMFRGDQARKQTLVDYGFRLPSALDNRPLNIDEFWARAGQTIFVSATPAELERTRSGKRIVEMINRPTGLLDPQIVVRPALHQVDDLLTEIRATVEKGERVLVLTLTKKMAEELAEYLREIKVKAKWIHADVQTIERVELLRGLRRGDFDVLIGINLLREGLDLVEVSLVAVLDADKEGFLRSARSLIQIMGRAARNLNGRVILYADRITDSMKSAMDETERRRTIQHRYNQDHGIVPESIRSEIKSSLIPGDIAGVDSTSGGVTIPKDPKEAAKLVESLRKQMFSAAAEREYEQAAKLRDAIALIQQKLLEGGSDV